MVKKDYICEIDDRFRLVIPKRIRKELHIERNQKMVLNFVKGEIILTNPNFTKKDYKNEREGLRKSLKGTFGMGIVFHDE